MYIERRRIVEKEKKKKMVNGQKSPCGADDSATSVDDPGHRGPFSLHNVFAPVHKALVTLLYEVNLVTKVKSHSESKTILGGKDV